MDLINMDLPPYYPKTAVINHKDTKGTKKFKRL
jgi:hypothetical protein